MGRSPAEFDLDVRSVFFIAFFAAVLASSFTVVRLQQSVNGPDDLTWARVAVVADTSGEALL